MKKTLTVISLLFTITAYSQQCNCDSNFLWLKSYMKRNYPGFKAKVTPATRAEYEAYTKKYEPLIKQADKPAYCEYFMLQWLKNFKDHHIQIQYDLGKQFTAKEQHDTAIIHKLDKSTEILPIDSLAFVKKLKMQKHAGIEGIYRYPDSSYTIAIIKSKNVFRDYAGVVLSSKTKLWHKGEVKLELRQTSDSTFDCIAYMQNHSFMIYDLPFKLYKNGNVGALGWKRIIPAEKPGYNSRIKGFNWQDKYDADYKNLNKDVSYLRIHSFRGKYGKQIDSVVNANLSAIKQHKYMVIDLRNNGGGADGSFQCLLPIIYSNPVKEIGLDYYATPDNIKAQEKFVNNDRYLSADDKQWMDSVITVMKAHPYQYISQAPDDTVKFDSVMRYPKKVVILMNHYCGSSTEQFLLYAKDCKKVTLMGEHSLGELDYSNLIPVNFPDTLPCTFWYPATVSRRIARHEGIDNIGIQPKIKLAPNADWIKTAEEYLTKDALYMKK